MGVVVTLHFWSLVTSDAARAAYRSWLSADERARMERFVYDRHREAYVVARGGLRERLGGYVNRAPDSLAFTYGPQGKPALPGGPAFNLSHAGDVACLAIQDDRDLGVDIEAHRPVEAGLPERFFAAEEIAALRALPEAQQKAAIFRCWTRKEAVIKALGGGLSIPLDAFAVSLDPDTAELIRLDPDYGRASDWALAPFDLSETLVGAVAVKTGGAPLALVVHATPEDLAVFA